MNSAMEQERELDRLLSQWLTGREGSAPEPLQPLLTAANALTPLRQAAPSATFTRRAETRMLRRARELAADDGGPQRTPLTNGSGVSTLIRRRTATARPLMWASAIAAILLVSVGGVFVVAANAQPGDVLYAMHRFEQGIQAQLTTNATARVQLHIDNAQAALQAFERAVARHEHSAELTDALDSFLAEHAAAGASLSDVTDATAHAKLAAALDQQRAQATNDLRTALISQDWSLRIKLTQALSALGVVVPVVGQVTLSETRDPSDSRGVGRITTVTITGAGFQPGAQLLLRGAPSGTTISVTADTLVAQVRAAAQAVASQGPIGVSNPDGTAAVSAKEPILTSGAHPTPSVEPTKNSGNGKPRGTPTP